MEKVEFRKLFLNQYILLDGATGSNLQKKGMPSGVCPEQWVCENKEVLIELQKEYVKAGSQAVYASTFAANAIKLKEFGLQDQVKELNQKLVAISKEATGGQAMVAGDVTMTGQQLEPLGPVKFEDLIDVYKEQMSALKEGGADFIVIETMMSLQETRAALIAAKESVNIPVMVTMSFGGDGRTLYGTDAKTAAIVIESLGADALGSNCSAGPDKLLPIIKAMRSVSTLPIVAKPNAGLPKLSNAGVTEYDMDAEEFVVHMKKLMETGATVLGGCCGTNPDYIKALKQCVEEKKPCIELKAEDKIYITSERNSIEWTKDCTYGTISSIDDSEIMEEWAEDIYDTMYDMIDDCMDEGVDAICICVDDTPGDGKEIMKAVIREATSYTSIPLLFKSSDPKILETALRVYPGKTAILSDDENPIIRKIAQKYGAVIL